MYQTVALCFFVFTVITAIHTFQIDPFNVTSSTVASPNNPSTVNTVFDVSIAGGKRDLMATLLQGQVEELKLRCDIAFNTLSLSSDLTVQGNCTVVYSGIDLLNPRMPTPINFLQNGASCFNFRIIENDNRLGLRGQFWDSLSPHVVTLLHQLTIPIRNGPALDVCIPFGNEASHLGSVDRVELALEGSIASDVVVQNMCSQPIVSCWHTISSIGEIDLQELSVGDKIEIRVTCQNYNSLPATTENIIATLAFDTSIAVIDSSSLVCVNTKSRIAIGGVLAFTATLDENEEVSCSVIVGMVGPGQIDNIGAAIVTDAREDPPIRSNEGSSVQGTAAFCEPPTLSSINVGGQDPTVPVQTSCQSHARCFRLVQENDCIFASNCVDNVCAVFCHDRFECILDPLCANSFWDQSDI